MVSLITDGDAEKASAPLEKASPEVRLKSKAAVLDNNATALGDVSPTAQFSLATTKLLNATAAESNITDPKS